ncbi:MAG: 30S ribosomal protein S16 [Patescibacteria group bacterium]
MLVIRLARIGHENLQKFRLIVQEKTASPKSGKVLASLGEYNPTNPDNKLTFDAAKVEQFLKNGATPSDTVARLLIKNGFKKDLVAKFILKYTKQKSKSAPKEEPKPAAPKAAEKPAEPKAEEAKPAEEPKAEEKPAEAPAAEKKE